MGHSRIANLDFESLFKNNHFKDSRTEFLTPEVFCFMDFTKNLAVKILFLAKQQQFWSQMTFGVQNFNSFLKI
jgi:hypothetical protein